MAGFRQMARNTDLRCLSGSRDSSVIFLETTIELLCSNTDNLSSKIYFGSYIERGLSDVLSSVNSANYCVDINLGQQNSCLRKSRAL